MSWFPHILKKWSTRFKISFKIFIGLSTFMEFQFIIGSYYFFNNQFVPSFAEESLQLGSWLLKSTAAWCSLALWYMLAMCSLVPDVESAIGREWNNNKYWNNVKFEETSFLLLFPHLLPVLPMCSWPFLWYLYLINSHPEVYSVIG